MASVRWRPDLNRAAGLDDGWRADRASRRVSTRQAESLRHEERAQFWSEAAWSEISGDRAIRGAGTRACRLDNRVEAFAGICARPPVLLRFRRQACLDRIVLDIGSYSRMLAFVADPMVVGFPLPERLPGETKDAVCFVGGGSLHRLQQTAWMDFGEQQGVDVIRHDDECSQFEVAQGDAFVQGIDHDAGDGGLTQIHGPARGLVQVAIDPNERFTGRSFGRGWETAMRETAMEVPGEE